MARELERFTRNLHKCLSRKSLNDSEIACGIVTNISLHFEEDLSKSELDFAFSSVFAKNNGLIDFLYEAYHLKFSKATTEIFALFSNLIQQFHERVSLYINDIKRVCLTCVSLKETSAAEKEKALVVVLQIFDLRVWNQDLEIDSVVETLLRYASDAKLSSLVLQKIFQVLGVLAHRYPENIQKHSSRLLNIYMNVLEKQFTCSSKVSFPLIYGSLKGLTGYFHNFEELSDTQCQKLYNNLKSLMGADHAAKFAQRAALNFIEHHGSLMSKYFYADCIWWNETLLKWVDMSGEDKKAGQSTIEQFYALVANHLCNEDEEVQAKTKFKYFMTFFQTNMLGKNTSPYVLSAMIIGFGLFAKPCKMHMSQDDVKYTFNRILEHTEKILVEVSLTEGWEGSKRLKHLPDYVKSLANILAELEDINSSIIVSVQHISVLLIQTFPQVYEAFHQKSINAMQTLLFTLAAHEGRALEDFLSVTMYQGILRTCSHHLVIDVDLLKEEMTNKNQLFTYKSYIPLWKSLLSVHCYKELGASLVIKQIIVEKLFDEFVQVVLLMLEKLDLSICNKSKTYDAEDFVGNIKFEAVTPSDFKIFINLVDLFQELIPEIDHNLFYKWVESFVKQLTLYSSQKPLISGFYKMLVVTFQMIEKLSFFGECIELNEERKALHQLLISFLQDMVIHVKYFKDELQVATLQAFLSMPTTLMPYLLKSAADVFVIVFKLGSIYLNLANLAMDSLEKWMNEVSEEDCNWLLTQVLPYLEPFFQSKSINIVTDFEMDLLEKSSSHGWRRGAHVRRKKMVEQPETELSKLQIRIIHLLGLLNNKTCLSFLDTDPLKHHSGWCDTSAIKLCLPFGDMKPTVYIDKLLPRIMELSAVSSNRRTRIAACELLHSVVMILLGNCIQNTSDEGMNNLFKRIIPCLLKLGCDADQVVYQLFHPLCLQMVHWYSSKFQLNKINSSIMVEAIMDGITNTTDAKLRDFSCQCLNEFVTWSIKQLSPREFEESPVNIKKILTRIYTFSVHPCSYKRLGAALAFNSIYRILREEESIIDQFWMELLYYLFKNLCLTSSYDIYSDNISEVISSIDHLERVFREKASLFNQKKAKRQEPPEFNGVLLSDVVVWLLHQCCCLESDARHKAMELVCSLAPCVTGFQNVHEFLQNYISINGSSAIMKICCVNNKLLVPVSSFKSLEECLLWQQILLTNLDCHVWLLGQQLFTPETLFKQNTNIFITVLHFVKVISQDEKFIEQFGGVNMSDSIVFNKIKCTVTVRVLDFITILCKDGKNSMTFVPENLFCEDLWVLLSMRLLQPSFLGFDIKNVEEKICFPSRMLELLEAMRDGLPKQHITSVYSVMQKKLESCLSLLFTDLPLKLQADHFSQQDKHIVDGLCILLNSKFLGSIEKVATGLKIKAKEIIDKVYLSVVKSESENKVCAYLQPTAKSYGISLLKFALLLDNNVDVIINKITTGPKIKNSGVGTLVRHGEHFLSQFQQLLFEHIANTNPCRIVDILLGELKSTHSAWKLYIVRLFLNYLNGPRKHSSGEEVALRVLLHWHLLENWAKSDVCRSQELISLLYYTCLVFNHPTGCLKSHEGPRSWLLKLLSSNELNLQQKNHVLDFLPYLSSEDDEDDQLWCSLSMLKGQHFPPVSTEFPEGSVERAAFISSFLKILVGMEVSGSRVLLKAVVAFSAGDINHVCRESIQSALKIFIERLDLDNQIKSIKLAYDVFCGLSFDSDIRIGSVIMFTVPLLQSSRPEAVVKFFAISVNDILSKINETIDGTSFYKTEQSLVSKYGAFLLVEVLFFLVRKTILEDKTCAITNAAFPGKVNSGKELKQLLTERTYGFRKLSLPTEIVNNIEIIELFRKAQCAAYNALASIIFNTSCELKFFSGLLIREQEEKNEIIWEKLIDCRKEICFPVDWSELPKRKKLMLKLRCENRQDRVQTSWSQSIQYITSNSQYLLSSSLSEDVTRFDFTTAVVRPKNVMASQSQFSTEVEMEMDYLNTHECMPVLCGLIQGMAELNIIKVPEETPDENLTLPDWMDKLRGCLINPKRHTNVKIFITKLIINNESVFHPYAKFFLFPLLSLLCSKCFGKDVNYMVTDLVTTIISWRDLALPNSSGLEKELASDLLSFLIERGFSLRRNLMKHNLELIKTLIEIWKHCLVIPYKLVFTKLTEKHDEDSEFGVQLVGIIFSNHIIPWETDSKNAFLNAVLQKLKVDSRNVKVPAAEIVGMCLKTLDPNLTGQLPNEDQPFYSALNEFLWKTSNRDDLLLYLRGISIHYSVVVDKFMAKLLGNLPQTIGNFRIIALELILTRIQILGTSAYPEMRSKGLLEMLNQKDEELIVLGLKLSLRMVELHLVLNENLCELFDSICFLTSHKKPAIRRLAYEVLMSAPEQGSNTQAVLLSGILDVDEELQQFVQQFWCSDDKLPSATPDRLLNVLGTLYHSQVEQHFLGYSCYILLEACSTSPDFKRNMFDQPLTTCTFMEYPILSSWRAKHLSLAPLFTQTLASQLSSLTPGNIIPVLRSTQASLAFQPTVDIDSAVVREQSSSYIATGSSLFSFSSKSKEQSTQKHSSTAAFVIPSHKRFLEMDGKKSQSFFALQNAKRNEKRKELQKQKTQKQESSFSMYRKYRTGDFPDIEISYSSVIKTLQAMAKLDAVIGRQLLVSLFLAIVEELDDAGDEFTGKMQTALNNILLKSSNCTHAMVGAVIEIALCNRKFVDLDPNNIVAVCKPIGLFSLGCLLLEECINCSDEFKYEKPAKRMKGSTEYVHWLRLAELYEGMGEWDIVQGIFSQKLESHDDLNNALSFEAQGLWREASDKYQAAAKSSISDELKDFCLESFNKCLSQLSRWEDLNKSVKYHLDEDYNNIWSDSWNEEKLLPCLFSAQIQLLLDGVECEEFIACVDSWMLDEIKSKRLTTYMSEELSLLYTYKKDFVQAKLYADQNIQIYLQDWAQISPVLYKLRVNRLLDLKRITEILLYLQLISDHNLTNFETKARKIMNIWNTNLPNDTSTLFDWQRKLAYRTCFMKQIQEKLIEYGCNATSETVSISESKLALIQLALKQKNFFFAKKYLLDTKTQMRKSPDASVKIRWSNYYAHCRWLSGLLTEDVNIKVKSIISAWEKTEPLIREAEASCCDLLTISINHQLSDYSYKMLQLLTTDSSRIDSSNIINLTKLMGVTTTDIDSIKCALMQYGLDKIHFSVSKAEAKVCGKNLSQLESRKHKKTMASAYYKMAQYCHSLITVFEGQLDEIHYIKNLVTSILRGMKHGSQESRRLFPSLLHLPQISQSLLDIFAKELSLVPEWMFLGWTSQILASLDTPIGTALKDLVIRMAETYPKAIVYPFRISLEKYTFDDISDDSQQAQATVLRLKSILLNDPLQERLINAFQFLCVPGLKFANSLRSLKILVDTKNVNIEKVNNEFNRILNLFFEIEENSIPQLEGRAFRKLNKYKNKMKQLHKTVTVGNREQMKIISKELYTIINSEKSKCYRAIDMPNQLSDLSPWLSEFQASKWENTLEIPGQYTGDSRPLPHYHVKIAGFHPEIKIMVSDKCPIRITIIGNDAKEYHYLVKHGEDLRLDERVQQLFKIMNKILSHDPACNQRKLSIATYQIVPFTMQQGIIKWVDGTKSIKELLVESSKEDLKPIFDNIIVQYREWIKGGDYSSACINYTPIQTIASFLGRVNSIPLDLLRKAIGKISPTAEVFYAKRHTFASSYSVMCIAHWLLGIGDRHLSNCLILQDTGMCLGIDFGHAFGTATQFLKVPELMPFRLTPHILSVMQPLQETGLITQTMVHTLQALRDNSFELLATMQVFVQEPSLDWINFTLKQNQDDVDSGSPEWFPRQKIKLARLKFEGANPRFITSEELKANSLAQSYKLKLLEIVRGDENCTRAKSKDGDLSTEDQVKCLIEQATDQHILGQTWEGWEPWI